MIEICFVIIKYIFYIQLYVKAVINIYQKYQSAANILWEKGSPIMRPYGTHKGKPILNPPANFKPPQIFHPIPSPGVKHGEGMLRRCPMQGHGARAWGRVWAKGMGKGRGAMALDMRGQGNRTRAHYERGHMGHWAWGKGILGNGMGQ